MDNTLVYEAGDCGSIPYRRTNLLGVSVMVAPQTLTLLVQVRTLYPLPVKCDDRLLIDVEPSLLALELLRQYRRSHPYRLHLDRHRLQ